MSDQDDRVGLSRRAMGLAALGGLAAATATATGARAQTPTPQAKAHPAGESQRDDAP